MSTTNILDLNNRIDALEKKHDAGGTAADTTYDNTASGLTAENVQDAIDELEAWTGTGTKDATGNPIILTDGAELEPTALTVTLEESQDGYSSCTVSRDSKNLLPITVAGIKAANTSGTWSGNVYNYHDVDFTLLTDNDNNVIGIKANGTASANTEMALIANNSWYPPANTYKLSGGVTNSIRIFYYDGTNYYNSEPNEVSFTTTGSETGSRFALVVSGGATANNAVFYPLVRLASISDATFEPYQHDTASISFGETINAGSVDFITGIVTVTSPEAKTLTLTPDNITLLKGLNVIRSAGNIDISYYPDNLYSAELVMNNRITALEEKIAILAGGTTGQVLTKTSNDDYDAAWETLPATRTTTRKTTKEEK